MKFTKLMALPFALAACTASQSGNSSMPAPGDASLKTTAAITEADLKERLYAVAHDSMIGRATGTIGHIKVTDHIAAEMKRLGLQPAGDNGTYFQSVPFVKRTIENTTLTVDGQPLNLWDDFVAVHPGSAIRNIDGAQVVFGGILQDTMKQLTREQAAGKVVILLNRSQNPGGRGTTPGSRTESAAAVMTINSSNAMQVFRDNFRTPGPTYIGGQQPTGDRGMPMIITADVAAKLMGMPVDSTTAPGTAGKTLRGTVNFKEEPVVARNVIAVLPGSDAALKNTYVAIGAHTCSDRCGSRTARYGPAHRTAGRTRKAASATC